MTLIKKRKSENKNGNGNLFPSLRNDFFTSRFFPSRFFDEDFWNGDIDMPLANMSETDKEFKFDISVPGMKKEDFTIDVDNGMLSVSSEKEEEKEDKDKNYTRREFSYSSFSRSFHLPENVDENNINAKYDNGILHITIPKKEVAASKPKKSITVG